MTINFMLSFRPHTRQDIPLRVKWLNNKKISSYVVDDVSTPTDTKKEEKWFDNYEKNSNKTFFTICNDGVPIGFMGLTIDDKRKKNARIFIMIGEDKYRGKGFGKIALKYLIGHAFENLGLKYLSLEVDKHNIAGIRLYKSFNFEVISDDSKKIQMMLNRSSLNAQDEIHR